MERMEEHYPGEGGYLSFGSPFQLVIAVLLSAQTTDKSVNKVTPELFERWPTPEAMAAADELEIQEVIHPLGFYKTKAKRCIECSATLLSEFGGEVPQTIDELVKLPGVGRKTANVVLNDAFRIAEGVAVDTHVGRIARRLGFSKHEDPVVISGYQFIVGGIVMMLVGAIGGGSVDFSDPMGILLMGYLALLSAVAYAVWGVLLKYNPVSRVTIFSFTTPIFGTILSMLILADETPGVEPLNLVATLVLVSVGILLLNYQPKAKSPENVK